MSTTGRLRRAVATHPFHATETALLAVVVLTTVGFGVLFAVSAPVETLWTAVVAMLVAGTLLPLTCLAHGAADLYALARADGWPSGVAVLRGLWRALEVAFAGAFVFTVLAAVGGAEALANNPGANPDARGTIGMVVLFSVGFALVFEAALVGTASVRLAWAAAGGSGGNDGE